MAGYDFTAGKRTQHGPLRVQQLALDPQGRLLGLLHDGRVLLYDPGRQVEHRQRACMAGARPPLVAGRL